MRKEWSKISLVFFFLVALIGTLLRSAPFIGIPLEYANLVHAHSHVAFQGWVYTVMLLLLTTVFLKPGQIKRGLYPLQFKLTVIVVIGVLISFSLQGYALYSIIFSTLFQLLNYWFIFRFLKDLKSYEPIVRNSISLRFVKTGLWLGLLSTVLPFGIGYLSAKGFAGTEAYQSLVYSFLHLQYNGWFLFVVLGLILRFLDTKGISYHQKYMSLFYWFMTIAVIPAIALSLLGMEFVAFALAPAIVSAIFLSIAIVSFIKALPGNLIRTYKAKSIGSELFFTAFVISFILKMLLQILSVLPLFKTYAFFNKPIIIAYLHLSLIGTISFLLLAMMIEMKWLDTKGVAKAGSLLLILGFVATECLLVLTGFGIYYNVIALIIGSMAMAVGILFMLFSRVSKIA
ncbi:MAG: hypothetical protein AAF361_02980 [Bacteroidota bacterium]